MCNKDAKVYDVREAMEKFGKYQILQYFLLSLPSLFVTMININYVFVAGDIRYRCRVPECEGNETSLRPVWWPSAEIDRCTSPVVRAGLLDRSCSNDSFTGAVAACTHWVYESNDTVVAELDLACQPWKVNLIGTIHNVGTLFSMLITGWMCDRLGRKPTVIFGAVASCIGIFKTFATSYYVYTAIEFIESLVSGGVYPATTVLMLEIGGLKTRILAAVLFAYVIYLGETVFACIAMVVPYWKNIIRIINIPPIFFIFYIFLIRESPRWQILNGKTEEAKRTIEHAATMNKINIDKQDLNGPDDTKLKQKFNINTYEKKEGLKNILRSKEIMKRVLVVSVCKFTAGFVYFGLMINSVLLPGDKYLNFLLSAVMSFPGELIALFLMNKVGRKLPLIIGFLLCGAMCVASAYITSSWGKITSFLVGKMVISLCFTGVTTYTMELYPTSTRGSLLGLGAFTSRVGVMLAPLTPMLMPIFPALPAICFGGSALLSGALLTLTPETKDMPLMDTIEQVDADARRERKEKRDRALELDCGVTKM